MTELSTLKEEIKIIDYAKFIGFSPKKIGSYYTLEEHDSVRINPEKNIFFRNSTKEHGSVIDFGKAFTGKSIQAVIQDLESIYNGKHLRPEPLLRNEHSDLKLKKDFVLPKADKSIKNVISYLTKTRALPYDLIISLVKQGRIYQDVNKNCVFVSHKDGKPVFACLRGTNTYKKFIGDVAGSDYTYGCFYGNNSNTLVITESVIDALSFITLFPLYQESDCLSLSGAAKTKPIFFHLKTKTYDEVILALDNDMAGQNAAGKIKAKNLALYPTMKVNTFIPDMKDWNEVLVKEKI